MFDALTDTPITQISSANIKYVLDEECVMQIIILTIYVIVMS